MENMKVVVSKNFNRLIVQWPGSMRDFAKLVKVNENTLQRWKNAVSCPEMPNIEKMAEALNVSPMEFFKTDYATKAEPMSLFASRLTQIPDDVWDLAQRLSSPKDENWDYVRGALESAIEKRDEALAKKAAAKA